MPKRALITGITGQDGSYLGRTYASVLTQKCAAEAPSRLRCPGCRGRHPLAVSSE